MGEGDGKEVLSMPRYEEDDRALNKLLTLLHGTLVYASDDDEL
jgi:hypothetical protein